MEHETVGQNKSYLKSIDEYDDYRSIKYKRSA